MVKKRIFLLNITILSLFFSVCLYGEDTKAEMRMPTHADAAIVFAKFSGLFDRYVSPDATVNECVTFLNKNGIYFGLMEVVNGTVFTKKDCARVMGQIELVFSGDAEYIAGKVKLPKGVASWEEFCILNNIQYVQGYQRIVQAANVTQ